MDLKIHFNQKPCEFCKNITHSKQTSSINLKQSATIVIGILTHESHYFQRDVLRKTYLTNLLEIHDSKTVDYKFLLDRESPNLIEENKVNKDIFFLNATWTGRGLSYGEKVLIWWSFVTENYPNVKLIGKMDDDVFICVESLITRLQELSAHSNLYFGWAHTRETVPFESSDYKFDFIAPDFKFKTKTNSRIDEMFVVLEKELVKTVLKREYCHYYFDGKENCNYEFQNADFNTAESSIGYWLLGMQKTHGQQIHAVFHNDKILHYAHSDYRKFNLHVRHVCREGFFIYHKSTELKDIWLYYQEYDTSKLLDRFHQNRILAEKSDFVENEMKISSSNIFKLDFVQKLDVCNLDCNSFQIFHYQKFINMKKFLRVYSNPRPIDSLALHRALIFGDRQNSKSEKHTCFIIFGNETELVKNENYFYSEKFHFLKSMPAELKNHSPEAVLYNWLLIGMKRCDVNEVIDFDSRVETALDWNTPKAGKIILNPDKIFNQYNFKLFDHNERLTSNAERNYTFDYLWPRGFPITKVEENFEIKHFKFSKNKMTCEPILFSIDDMTNPDLGAIHRMTRREMRNDNESYQKEVTLPDKLEKQPLIVNDFFTPIGSTFTKWSFQNKNKQYGFLLYQPVSIPYEFADIWRNYIAQFFISKSKSTCVMIDQRRLTNKTRTLSYLLKERRERNSDVVWDWKNVWQHDMYSKTIVLLETLIELSKALDYKFNQESFVKLYKYLVEKSLLDEIELVVLQSFLKY